MCHGKLNQHTVSRSIRVPCGPLAEERPRRSRRFPSFAYQPRSTFLQDPPRELRAVGKFRGNTLAATVKHTKNTEEVMPEPHRAYF